MKVLVVLLLEVFTGCNANRLNADRQKPKLEVINNFLWDYGETYARAATNIQLKFRRTEFGKAVKGSLEKSKSATARFVNAVKRNLPPTTKAIIESSAEASLNLVYHTIKNVVDNYLEPMVKNNLEPLVESAAPVMEEALGQLYQKSVMVQETVSPYIIDLMERVDPVFQNILARLHALKESFDKTA